MIINFVTPSIREKKFSGGMYCILKYAQGLIEAGHKINIITPPGSKQPRWINYDGTIITPAKPRIHTSRMGKLIVSFAKRALYDHYNLLSGEMQRAMNQEIFEHTIPAGDFTIATAWDTALIVNRFGTGHKCYFMQHYEPYFSNDPVEKTLAALTYSLPLNKIVNSSWLKTKLSSHLNQIQRSDPIYQCTNAVDLDKFYIERQEKSQGKSVRLISYGGRGVDWKGFNEMALAVREVRRRLPDWNIHWCVYGNAALAPNNDVADYEPLGFLQPDQLRAAYNKHDILLSASWYESFPLFPIEAMACGLAVITTAKGTEDYAKHNENAIVVEEKNVSSISAGLERLITDLELRNTLSSKGIETAQRYGWPNSIKKMAACLEDIAASEKQVSS